MPIFDFQRKEVALDLTSPLPDERPVVVGSHGHASSGPASILSMMQVSTPVIDLTEQQSVPQQSATVAEQQHDVSAQPDRSVFSFSRKPVQDPRLARQQAATAAPTRPVAFPQSAPVHSGAAPSAGVQPLRPAPARPVAPITRDIRATVGAAAAGPAPQTIGIFSLSEGFSEGLAKLPFLQAVRAAYPNTRITWITSGKSAFSSQLRPLTKGLLDSVKAETGIADSRFSFFSKAPFSDHYSLLIDTQSKLWRSRGVRKVNHDVFISGAGNFRLSDKRPDGKWIKPVHVVDHLSELMHLATGARLPEYGVPLSVPADIDERASFVLPQGPVYVGIAPGENWRPALWPLGRYVEFARRQVRLGRVPVFILGKAEEGWEPILRSAVPQALFPEQNEDVWGRQYSPLHTIAIARYLHVAVANDSGASHLLAAGGAPLVGLYGPSDPTRSAPRNSRSKILEGRAFNRPIIEDIPIDAVMDAVNEVLAD